MMSIKTDIQQPAHHEEDHSDDVSLSDNSTTDHSQKDGGASMASSDCAIGQGETVAVNRSKLLVYGVLAFTAAAFGTSMYLFVSGEEQDDFESEVRYVLPRSPVQPNG
jgi:hypothetical protein